MGTGIASPLWPPGIINNVISKTFVSVEESSGFFGAFRTLVLKTFYRAGSRRIRASQEKGNSIYLQIHSVSGNLLKVAHCTETRGVFIVENDNMVKPHDLLVLVG